MKVTRATTRIIQTPADHPWVVGVPVGAATREFVTLELDTDDGIQGVGVTFFGAALTNALRSAVDTLAGLVIGRDPMPVEAIVGDLRAAQVEIHQIREIFQVLQPCVGDLGKGQDEHLQIR